MPKSRGGGTVFGQTLLGRKSVRNNKLAHRCCNSLRGAAGHCVGALACARAVAGPEWLAVARLLGRWQVQRR